ncbi:MAG: glycosyltransferase family 4 protein [Pseudomonadota bacterium]
MGATAAIYHHPDTIESDSRPLAGRRTAGQSFLAGYAKHVDADVIHCAADADWVIGQFRTLMQQNGWNGPIEGALTSRPADLAASGTFMLPGPSLDRFAWVRRRVGQQAYSLCGITHTVSTRRIMESLYALMAAPVEDWDAIICTSKAVQSVVARELELSASFLSRRFGARRVPMPQLPVIPLGTDTATFAHDPAARVKWRASLDIGEDDIAVMSMGRLSVFEKMDPTPLFLSLQRAAKKTERKLHLLMVGWFGDENSEKIHRDAATACAPDVSISFPNGKDQDLRYSIWSAADIFALPVDNIQETFGLAPIEAMAAGLPIVCSDWNGFKDTVIHGETGIRVRTFTSAPGTGQASANRFEDNQDNYFQYLGLLQQRTVVDVPEMAAAFSALIGNPDLRRTMGQAGVRRAKTFYDWSAIIPQYQALWAEQTARRLRGQPSSPCESGEIPNPSSADPFYLYQDYPSDRLLVTSVLSADAAMTAADVDHLIDLSGARLLKRIIASAEQIAAVQQIIAADGPMRLSDIVQRAGLPSDQTAACVLWLAKYDRIRIQS